MEVEKLTDEELANSLSEVIINDEMTTNEEYAQYRAVVDESVKRIRSLSALLRTAKEGLEAAVSLIDSYCPNPALRGDEIRVCTVRKAMNDVRNYTKGETE